MAESFNVGEIAIISHAYCYVEYIGQECEVTGPLIERSFWSNRNNGHSGFGLRYAIRTADGREFAIAPECLRKKRPPPQFIDIATTSPLQVTRWSDCPWQPKETSRV